MIREYIIKISDEIMEEEVADRPQELVRCKDCVHGYISEFDVNKEIWCCGYKHILSTVKPDFYCADGERK